MIFDTYICAFMHMWAWGTREGKTKKRSLEKHSGKASKSGIAVFDPEFE